jgi:hypothetical protein
MCRNVDSASVATRSSVGDPVKVFILESPVIFRRFATGVEEFPLGRPRYRRRNTDHDGTLARGVAAAAVLAANTVT